MPIDRNAPPTNKLLLECGPEGTREGSKVRRRTAEWIEIPIHDTVDDGEWVLHLSPFAVVGSEDVRYISLVCIAAHDDHYGGDLPLGNIATLGEVIDLYKRLSQRKWPGSGRASNER